MLAINLGLGLTSRPVFGNGVPAFSPTDIASLEALYEPWDLTSMRIGRTGSGGSPAANSVVGMLLDKSEMDSLSASDFIAAQPELVTNGAFDSDTAWTDLSSGTPPAPATISGGVLNLPRTDAANRANSYQQITLPANQWCLISFVSVSQTIRCSVGSAPGAQNHGFVDAAPGGTATLLVRPTLADPYLTLFCATNATTGQVDNVSVKAVPGNHLIAPSDAARPNLRESGGLYYLEFDGVDDELIGAQFSSSLTAPITHVAAFFAANVGVTSNVIDSTAGTVGVDRNYIQVTNAAQFRTFAGANNDFGAVIVDTPYVVSLRNTAIENVSRVNAGAQGATLSHTSADYEGVVVGATFASSNHFSGGYYGHALFDSDLTGDDLANVEAYFAAKSGVTL